MLEVRSAATPRALRHERAGHAMVRRPRWWLLASSCSPGSSREPRMIMFTAAGNVSSRRLGIAIRLSSSKSVAAKVRKVPTVWPICVPRKRLKSMGRSGSPMFFVGTAKLRPQTMKRRFCRNSSEYIGISHTFCTEICRSAPRCSALRLRRPDVEVHRVVHELHGRLPVVGCRGTPRVGASAFRH